MATEKAIVPTEADLKVRKKIIEHFRHEVDFDNDIEEEWWQLLDDGYTLGIFQIEQGAGAIELAQQIKPRSVEDLAIHSALNRPGPLRSGDTARYVARRQKRDKVEYADPILEDILDVTYGVFMFQEQVLAYFGKIGYDLSEADYIRKIVGKKLVKEMEEELPRYLERAEQHMSNAHAMVIWDLIANFSKYGFNKAHAIAYATITAWTIYCKGRWQVEFYMASIEKNRKKVALYVAEARRRGITVLPPHINKSGPLITHSGDNEITYGLADIKGVKSAAVQIANNGKYDSPEDFVSRSGVNAGIKKIIIEAGALDSFEYRLGVCETCLGKGRKPAMVPKKSGVGEKRVLVDCDCHEGWVRIDIPPIKDQIEAQRKLLEIVLSDPITDLVREKYEERKPELDSWTMLRDKPESLVVTVPAIVREVNVKKIKSGKNLGRPWATVRLEWEGLGEEVKVWSDEYQKYDVAWQDHRVGEFTLKAAVDRNGNWGVTAKKAQVWA